MKKKIGILTYHNNRNRGSILQAYCLAKSLEEKTQNCDVEIIDYRTLSIEIKRMIGGYIHKKTPIVFFKRITDYHTCIDFLKEENILSSEKIITNNHKKAINFLNKQNYDMIIVGSDTIWKLKEKDGILPITRPFPNAYFLDPNLNSLKVSYAASMGSTDYRKLSKNKINIYKRHLSSFDKISVRDQHSEDFLRELGVSNITRVPDPTILMDLPESDLKNLLSSNGVSLNKPILAINQLIGNSEKLITKHYRQKGYQIVAPNRSRYADVNLFGKVTPLEYYSLHKYFDFVISGSLHTTIFSIKNGTPFATLDFSSPHLIDKKETLLEEFSLLDRHIKVDEQNTESVLDKLEGFERELDHKHIQKRLSSMREKGFAYIQKLGEMLHEKEV